MNTNIWTANAVSSAILQGNVNLELVLSNYLKAFIVRLGDYDFSVQDIQSINLLQEKVLDGIEKLEGLRKEFLSVIDMLASGNSTLLIRYLPDFFEKLLIFYEDHGVVLYTGTGADLLRNDHYRFFNQSLFISLTALLIENQCFKSLAAILHAKFKVLYKSYRIVREVNFIRFREYNYTLNEFHNTSEPKRISVTADFIFRFSQQTAFDRLVKADILLYYLSLWNNSDEILDPFWYPELSVYNRDRDILPYLVSKAYFDKIKVLFGVSTVEQFRQLLDKTDDRLQRSGVFRVPLIKDGLMYDKVGSID